MNEPTNLESRSPKELFLAHIDALGESVEYLWRRHDLPEADRDDFESFVKLRLIENDYERIQSFRGDSSFRTYLVAIVRNLFHSYRRQHWGRWRPSKAARDGGLVAVELETLLYRDGYTFSEAFRILTISRDRDVSREELSELAAELPVRDDVEEISGGDAVRNLASDVASPTEEYTVHETGDRVARALQEAIARLDSRDRVLLKMRFADEMEVPAIGRVLGTDDHNHLYYRVKKLTRSLRKGLEASGIGSHDVETLLEERVEIDLDLAAEFKSGDSCPSNQVDEGEIGPPN